MNKQEVIKILEKKRETALENFEYYRDKEDEKYEKMNRARVDSYTIAIQAVEKMEEAEKVEVPEFIAKLIRKYKERNGTLFCSIADLYNDSDEYKWYVDNAGIYERAWVNGYTVKQKRWVVKAPNGKYFISLAYGSGIGSLKKCSAKTKDDAYPFDDKSKAEAVAVLVEGSVEEV